MKKLGTWVFAACVAALAMADWCPSIAPADGDGVVLPLATVNGVGIKAEVREVTVDGATEKHFFLVLSGEGAGTVKVRCDETRSNPGSRMMPTPKALWTRDVAFDTAKGTEIDLGMTPEAKGWITHSLVMPSEEGNVMLGWWEHTPELREDGEAAIFFPDDEEGEVAVEVEPVMVENVQPKPEAGK